MNETRALLISIIGSQLRSENEISISDRQLLNFVISFCDWTVPATIMTDRLFAEFATLSAIIAAPASRLRTIEGMTDRLNAFLKFLYVFKLQALKSGMPERIRITGCADSKAYLMARMRDMAIEEMHALFLDNNCHLLSSEVLSRGTTNHVEVYPVEIVRRATQIGATKVILAHNHPSRRISPSDADISLTAEVEAVCQPLGIVVEDHVIIAGESLISFRELGLLGRRGRHRFAADAAAADPTRSSPDAPDLRPAP